MNLVPVIGHANSKVKILALLPLLLFFTYANGQLRQVYSDLTSTNNTIKKISFYSSSQGYIASTSNSGPWIGYTSDSGHSFVKKNITSLNVNFALFPVNLTFGFGIRGVKAFNQNTVIVYGEYGNEPSILYSTNAGNSFSLVYWSGYTGSLTNGITDIIFPENNAVGYAIDDNHILKTNDQGQTWSAIATYPGYVFTNLEAANNSTVFVLNTGNSNNGLIKTTDAGSSWQTVTLPGLPARKMKYAYFLTATTGWLDMSDQAIDNSDSKFYFYKTIDGGSTWTLLNNIEANSFYCYKMKFTDVNTGYALSTGFNTVFKTSNSGLTWEPLPANDVQSSQYALNDLQCISATQLWAGGDRDFLEISTNGGGTPLAQAYFRVDTSGVANTGNVNLINYSASGYTYRWLVNNTQVSTGYNASYLHSPDRVSDTISLIVSNGVNSDTVTKFQDFFPRVRVLSFSPSTAGSGTLITIKGANFQGAASVSFGGVAAAAFTVVSASTITATVSNGASGYVKVITPTGKDSLAGFSFVPAPVISSFTPAASTAGSNITITGANFTGATAVNFDGIPAASFTIVSATTITAVTPSGSSGNISISTPGGTSLLPGYIALPTITSFSPQSGPQGTPVTITGTSFTGVTSVTAGAVSVLSFTINSSTSITASIGGGASGEITVTKPGGNASLPGFTWYASPVINSFSPASGPAGTAVTITGAGFNAITGNNIVYFGAVKATVTAANANTLTVIVPIGATYQSISVVNTASHLIAYSNKPFLLTYTGGNLSGYTYGTRTTIHPTNMPMNVSLGDLDADGKTDLLVSSITSDGNDGELLLYKNKSTTGTALFENPISFPHLGFRGAIARDLDGDGKPDIAVLSSLYVSTFLNTSSPGSISFIAGPVLSAGNQLNMMAIADADGDGKPDIFTSNGLMFRNISTPGNILFEKSQTVFGVSRNVLLADINGDDKPDLIFSDNNNTFHVLKNSSIKGVITFETPISFTGFSHTFMVAGDMDGDGKTDLVSADYYNFKLGIIRNTSTGGSFSFDAAVEISAQNSPFGLSLSDIDGDGKPDIATTLVNYNLAAFRNTSTSGSISFGSQINFVPGTFYGDHIVALGDIDGDGKNDAVTSTSNPEGMVSVHLNTFSTSPAIQSFYPLSGKLGDTITITGTNLTGATAVSFGGTPVVSFTVEPASIIKAVLGTGASGAVTVTTPSGTISAPGFTYLPSIASFSPITGTAGTKVTITGQSFSGATNVSFGGAAAVSFTVVSNTTIEAVIGTGATGKITVTNAAGAAVSIAGFTFIASLPPVITAVTPSSAEIGTIITISGSNFSSSINGNDVYFGTVKAKIVSASSNTLTIIVPNAAVYDHIQVTTHSLTAVSPKPFVTTFAGTPSFTAATFGVKKDFSTNEVYDQSDIHFKDLNGDSLLDIILPGANGFQVLKNNGSNNNEVSLGNTQLFTAASTNGLFFEGNLSVADFDGDGKPDVVQMDRLSQLGIRRNISTTSLINFDTAIIIGNQGLPLGGPYHSFAIGDFNQDGKPDIATLNAFGSLTSVYINTTIGASVSFNLPINIFVASLPTDIRIEDIDNDQKPDIVISSGNGNAEPSTVSVLRNITAGKLFHLHLNLILMQVVHLIC